MAAALRNQLQVCNSMGNLGTTALPLALLSRSTIGRANSGSIAIRVRVRRFTGKHFVAGEWLHAVSKAALPWAGRHHGRERQPDNQL